MSQQKEDFIAACENALHFYGGVPAAIVPDNLKAAVTKSNRYEPALNETLLTLPTITERPSYQRGRTALATRHW